MSRLQSVAELEACVGAAGLAAKMKIIDFIDDAARGWLAQSPLAFVSYAGAGAPVATLAGGAKGFASAADEATLLLPRAALDVSPGSAGQGVATLFLIPGIGETLRINGRVKVLGDERIEIAVEECFVHCAKALIRSDFWDAEPCAAPDDPADFLAAARFLALATADARGGADISPKGDPAGGLIRLQGGVATLAERPGNRLAYGFHNMLEQPLATAIVIVPGATKVAHLSGTAAITGDEAARAAFAVDGKTPVLLTRIEGAAPALSESRALAAARLWPAARHGAPGVDPSAVLVAHVKANKSRGPEAAAMRQGVTREVIAMGLEDSYRSRLY